MLKPRCPIGSSVWDNPSAIHWELIRNWEPSNAPRRARAMGDKFSITNYEATTHMDAGSTSGRRGKLRRPDWPLQPAAAGCSAERPRRRRSPSVALHHFTSHQRGRWEDGLDRAQYFCFWGVEPSKSWAHDPAPLGPERIWALGPLSPGYNKRVDAVSLLLLVPVTVFLVLLFQVSYKSCLNFLP